MSRSYKKHGLLKLGDSSMKKIFNRRLRHRKQLDYPSGCRYKREPGNCSWEISDIIFGYFAGQKCDEKFGYRYFIK